MTKTHDHDFFYKYTDAKGALKILCLETKWSSPVIFNDPFDCQLQIGFDFSFEDFSKALRNRINELVLSDDPVDDEATNYPGKDILKVRNIRHKLTSSELSNSIKTVSDHHIKQAEGFFRESEKTRHWPDQICVFCVSEEESNLLMWAHYADKHKGAVIKLRYLPEVYTRLRSLKKVDYKESIPYLTTFDECLNHFSGTKRMDHADLGEINKAFFTKSKHWKYEKEWRCTLPRPSYNEYGIATISPEEIEAIYLGCRMTEDFKKEILDIVDDRLKNVHGFQANTKTEEYGLDLTERLRPK